MFSIQNYTTYSIFSGTLQPKDWVKAAKELGYDAVGISDKQNAGGWVEFQKACDEHEISPIYGEEFIIVEDALAKDKTNQGVVLLYAKDEVGYRNLVRLNNFSHDRGDKGGFYYRARVDVEHIKEFSEGVIAVVPCIDGYGTELSGKGFKYPERWQELAETFEECYYGHNPFVPEDSKYAKVNEAAKSFKLALPPILAFNCHTTLEKYSHLQDVVKQVSKAKSNSKSLAREVFGGWMPTIDEVKESVDEDFYQECASNLDDIKQACSYRIPLGTYHMPEAELKYDSIKEDLIAIIGEGFKRKLNPDADFEKLEDLEELRNWQDGYPHECLSRGDDKSILKPLSEYVDRLFYEMSIIEELGFPDYFKLVWDFCNVYDHKSSYGRGFARGSAAGSLISYLLHITRVDPIRHGLIFERFLNPDRNDLPDIDLDFSSAGRDWMKDYIKDTYGADKVVTIGSYNRFRMKSAIGTVARAYNYGIPDNEGNIVQYTAQSLNGLLANLDPSSSARGEAELEELREYESFEKFYQQHQHWVDNTIMPLLETVSTISVHPAGMLILPEPTDDCMFTYSHSGSDQMITQWRDRFCEARGFPKFDILGIENLDIIASAKRLVKERHGEDIPEFEEISFKDEKAMELIASGDTQGIFQLQSYLARNYMPIAKPSKFEHLVAITSLLRKGPMESGAHDIFAKILNGEVEAHYEHEDLKPLLSETYGLIVYQEQMMDIVRVIGGLTNSEADYVRKACGKKKLEEMQKWEQVFKAGGVDNGYSIELLNSLWDKIVAFAEYSFNKSHAVAYMCLAYYQAWIKARYPLEYWCAVLQHSNNNKRSGSSVYAVKARAESHGINFVYPTINGFSTKFSPAGDESIYWPISVISGFGPAAIREVDEIGKQSFDSLREMMETLPTRYVTKNCYVNLIRAGFFDPLGPPWEVMEEFFELRNEMEYKDEVPFEYMHQNEFKWALEKRDSFGVLVKPWKEVAPFHKNCRSYTNQQLAALPDKAGAFVGGYVDKIWLNVTKYGDWYAKMIIVDTDEKYTVMCWNEFWENEDLDKPLLPDGTIDEIDGRRRRPKQGDLVEVIAQKQTWNERPQLYLNEADAYVRVVWTEDEIEMER